MTRHVVLLLVAISAMFMVQVMVLILAPLKGVELGLPASTAVALIAAWGLLGIIADIPGSALSDALGRRFVISLGGVAMAVAAVMLALATDFVGILGGMVLFGLGQALSFGPALAFLTEVTAPSAHARVQGVNGAAQGMSSVVAALLAGSLAQFGSDVGFIAVMVLALIVTASVLAAHESSIRPVGALSGRSIVGSYGRALRMTLGRPPIAFASLLSVLYAIVFLVVAASVLPLVLVEIEGYTAVLAGAVLAFRNLVSALLSLSFAAVTQRFGLTRTVVYMSWLAALGTALVAVTTTSPLLLLIALAIQAAGVAYGAAAANVLVKQATSEGERALGMSATTVTSRITVLVIPLVIAPLIAPSTSGAAFLVAAALSVPVILLMHAVARRVDDPESRPAASHGSAT
jgi:MFS family permease